MFPCNGEADFEKLPELAAQLRVATKYIYKKMLNFERRMVFHNSNVRFHNWPKSRPALKITRETTHQPLQSKSCGWPKKYFILGRVAETVAISANPVRVRS